MRKALMLASAGALVLSACQPADENKATEYASDEAVDVNIVAPAPAADATRETRMETAPSPPQGVRPPQLQVRAQAVESPSVETVAPSVQPRRVAPEVTADIAPAEPVRTIAPPRPEPLAPIARIAYAFNYVMSVPKDRGAELMSRHEFACVSAGPGLCQVVAANADWTSQNAGGKLELRGQPEWINRFRSTLAVDAQNAGGRLDEALTEGEDVTRGMDEAETGAKTTAAIAERIRELQRRQGGTMAQRLEIERQLADLQRQQDAQQIQLRELNARVQSAKLTLQYREGGVMAVDNPTRPVARALQNAFGLSMGMLAVLITAGSIALPIAVIGGAVWWATVRRRKVSAA